MQAVRRAIPVDAVQCRKDNAPEVQAFLDKYTPRSTYRPNQNGGWQHIQIHDQMNYGSRLVQVWVDTWLVDVPEHHSFKNIHESEFERLYRTRHKAKAAS